MEFYILAAVFVLANGVSLHISENGSVEYATVEAPAKTVWNGSNTSTITSLVDKLPKSLKYIGTSSDGKAIFAESSPMGWHAAKGHCRSFNLTIFSMLSQEQKNVIMAADLDGEYWTAAHQYGPGQDAFTWDRWDARYSKVQYWNRMYFHPEVPYQLCLSIAKEIREGELICSLHLRLCSEPIKVLCEA